VAVEDQPARTSLAWGRTLLGCVAVAALVARGVLDSGLSPVLEVLPLLVAAAVGAVAYRRQRALQGVAGDGGWPPRTSRWSGPALTVAVLVLAGVALVLTVTDLSIAP
jgi:hypothetical protein